MSDLVKMENGKIGEIKSESFIDHSSNGIEKIVTVYNITDASGKHWSLSESKFKRISLSEYLEIEELIYG